MRLQPSYAGWTVELFPDIINNTDASCCPLCARSWSGCCRNETINRRVHFSLKFFLSLGLLLPPTLPLLSAKLLDSSLPFLIPLSHQSFQTPPMPFFSGLFQWLLQVPQWLPHESCSGQDLVLVWTPQAAMTVCWLLL